MVTITKTVKIDDDTDDTVELVSREKDEVQIYKAIDDNLYYVVFKDDVLYSFQSSDNIEFYIE